MAAAAKTFREHERDWDAKATQSAIDAAKAVVGGDGVNARASISSLSDIEWGWIVAAAIFAWIKTKSHQAVAESSGYDQCIRFVAGSDPQPWEAGAVSSILGSLANIEGIDWGQSVGGWSKDQIVSFIWQAHKMTLQALERRDDGATDKITKRLSQSVAERENSAAHGGPLMDRKELNDEVPF